MPSLAARRGKHGAVLRDLLQRLTEGSIRPLVAASAAVAICQRRDIEHEDEVHARRQGQRRIAPGEPARGDEQVVNGGDAETAELHRDRREVAALLDGSEAVEREAPVTVVGLRHTGYLRSRVSRRVRPGARRGLFWLSAREACELSFSRIPRPGGRASGRHAVVGGAGVLAARHVQRQRGRRGSWSAI